MFGFFFFQAEDGIRDLVRSRGLGDVYKRQAVKLAPDEMAALGRHFEKMSVPPMPAKDPDLAAVGKYIYHLSLIHI